MRDGDLVAAVVAGDPAALAAAYDQFAPALYGYCRSLLSEPADAAGAVRDTFVVAEVKLPLLRDPSRLRPWLYAVARNECRRRLHGDGAAVRLTPDEYGDGEATADLGLALVEAQQREMVSSALGGLDPGDREIVELNLRHEFYGADLADALGVPRNQAQALTTRARTRFETALGALMVARSSVGSCQELSWILGDWDGELTAPLRKQVRRHVSTCEICGEHRRRQVNPLALLSVLPEPVLPESLQHEALSLLADTSPDAAEERAVIADRAEPFARSGFPAAFVPAAGVLVAVFAVFGGGAMLAANTLHHATPPVSSAVASAVPSAQAAPAVNTPKPSLSGHKKAHGKHGASAGGSGTPSYTPGAGKSGKSSRPVSHPSSAKPSKSKHTTPPTTSPPSSPTPSASSSSPSPTDSPTDSPTPSSGVLGTIIGWLGAL
jgi:RNA polymerase sigma factor (sigma-70 family)